MLVHALQPPRHRRASPQGCLDPLHLHLSCASGKPEHRPQENVSQAWPSICLCHWHHGELQLSGSGRTRCQGRGRRHVIGPAAALRTLPPTLGFLTDTRAAHEPSSPMSMATHRPAVPCQPTSWQRHYRGEIPSATCPLSLSVDHHCPCTGLQSQAPGFQSALWEADRGWAGLGETSLPHSHQLLARGLDVGTRARSPDGNCCHLIMHAYDISQKHLTVSCRLGQIK